MAGLCYKCYPHCSLLFATYTQNILMSNLGMIFFGIIMLHLLIGFGYVMYKLNSKKKVGDKE